MCLLLFAGFASRPWKCKTLKISTQIRLVQNTNLNKRFFANVIKIQNGCIIVHLCIIVEKNILVPSLSLSVMLHPNYNMKARVQKSTAELVAGLHNYHTFSGNIFPSNNNWFWSIFKTSIPDLIPDSPRYAVFDCVGSKTHLERVS